MKSLTPLMLIVLLGAALAGAIDISGKWEVEATFDDPRIEAGGFDCALKQEEERLTGTCSDGTASLAGEIDGPTIIWRVTNGGQPPVTTMFSGTLNRSGTAIEGRLSGGGKGGSFTATKG